MENLNEQFVNFFSQNCKNSSIEELNEICLEHIRDREIKKKFLKDINEDKKKIHSKKSQTSKTRNFIYWFVIIFVVSVAIIGAYYKQSDYESLSEMVDDLVFKSPCLVDQNEVTLEITRPLFNCEICRGVSTVPVETNLTKERFEDLYGYSSLPVLVKGTSNEWSAVKLFTFDFIKDLYVKTKGALQMVDEECQFFPYDTDFSTLEEVFNMSREMADLKLEKWYVGWSNCVPEVEKELRKHYSKPSFLPDDSESTHLDWIFMGGWGYGAPLHVHYLDITRGSYLTQAPKIAHQIDSVERPSWQAQLSGKKTWVLVPSVECESVCPSLQVTVETGDIIVLNTNQWYHSTYIHPGEISITIGSEYD